MIASRPGRSLRNRDVVLVIASATLLVLPAVQADEQAGFRFRSGVDLINVTATVTDRCGRFAPGLTQRDFVVYEDDKPVEVKLFSAERVPVSLGIILDTSGSMQGDKMENALAAIERFVGRLFNADDEVFLSGFSSDVDLIQEWTTDRNVIIASLRRVRAMGGTAMYDAVVDGVPMAHGGRNRKKAVVLISDGNDTNSRTGIQDVRQVVRQSEVLIYAIGIDGQGEPTTLLGRRSFRPRRFRFRFHAAASHECRGLRRRNHLRRAEEPPTTTERRRAARNHRRHRWPD